MQKKLHKTPLWQTTSRFLRTFLVLAAFSAGLTFLISPSSASAAQTTLNWSTPSTYADGTPMTVQGYKVYQGTASGTYTQSTDVGNQNSYTASNLADGSTYYFAITAYDSSSVESAYSNELSRSFAATYSITASAGSGGSINFPSGTSVSSATSGTTTVTTATAPQGATLTVSVVPASGYTIAGVTVDGSAIGAVSSYTFSNITANHTIAASFTPSTVTASYSISASAGTGGSISPSGTISVQSGASQSFSITPAAGYAISAVTVDGTNVGNVSSYTFSSVAANHSITASFASTTTGHWDNITTSTSTYQDGTPKYMEFSPVKADATGKVTSLRVYIYQFGSPTAIRLALYSASGARLTQGSMTVSAAGWATIPVTAVSVTQGSSYYIAAEAASGNLYRFGCGASSGGYEAANSYSNGLPATLPSNRWGNKLLTASMYIQ